MLALLAGGANAKILDKEDFTPLHAAAAAGKVAAIAALVRPAPLTCRRMETAWKWSSSTVCSLSRLASYQLAGCKPMHG